MKVPDLFFKPTATFSRLMTAPARIFQFANQLKKF